MQKEGKKLEMVLNAHGLLNKPVEIPIVRKAKIGTPKPLPLSPRLRKAIKLKMEKLEAIPVRRSGKPVTKEPYFNPFVPSTLAAHAKWRETNPHPGVTTPDGYPLEFEAWLKARNWEEEEYATGSYRRSSSEVGELTKKQYKRHLFTIYHLHQVLKRG